MFPTKTSAALILALAATGFSGVVHAQSDNKLIPEWSEFFKMKMIDKNKDGMVSKKEFMAMMDKAYDMKLKAMSAKADMMTEAQMQEFLKSLYVGGN